MLRVIVITVFWHWLAFDIYIYVELRQVIWLPAPHVASRSETPLQKIGRYTSGFD